MQPHAENSVNVPAFLHKLWKMVHDPKTDHLICWSPTGTSFVIQNKAQFWYDLLPVYYKHNNMSSFVRQLNMYGFHKISSLESPENDKDEIHFYHPNFQKNRPEILKHIRRKVSNNQKVIVNDAVQKAISSNDLNRVLSDITMIQGRQSNVDSQLASMKQENAILWRELALLRQKHHKQQQIVNKLIQFLVTLVNPGRMNGLATKRVLPLMINESPAKKPKTSASESSTSEGPIIHELETHDSDEVILQSDLLNEAAQNAMIIDPEKPLVSDFTQCDIVEELFSDGETVHSDSAVDPLSLNAAAEENVADEEPKRKLFEAGDSQDSLLSDLMNGNYNTKSVNDVLLSGNATAAPSTSAADKKDEENKSTNSAESTALARKNIMRRLNSVASMMDSSEDLDLHLENTQTELDKTFKELLSGCSSLNANVFLDFFNDETSTPSYGLGGFDDLGNPRTGSELAAYDSALDFTQLFNEDSNSLVTPEVPVTETLDADGSITTPQILAEEPLFPTAEDPLK